MENKDQHQTGFKPTTLAWKSGTLTAVPQPLPPNRIQTEMATDLLLFKAATISFFSGPGKKATKQKLEEFN